MKELLAHFRGSLAWGAAAAALGAVCLTVLLRPDTTVEGKEVLFRYADEEIRLLRVSFPASDRPAVAARRTGPESWRLLEPVEDEGDNYTLRRIAGYMSSLFAVQRFEEGTEEAQAMGPARVRVEVERADGTSHWAEIGRLTASGFRAYARVSSRPGVWVVSKALWDAVNRPADEYRDRSLFTVDYFDLAAFEVRAGEGEPVRRFEKAGEKDWRITAPYEGRGSAKELFAFTYELDRARFASFDAGAARLPAEPDLSLTFFAEDGEASRVDFLRREEAGGAQWFALSRARGVAGPVEARDLDRRLDFSDPFRFRERLVLADLGPRRKQVTVQGMLRPPGMPEDRNISFRVTKRQLAWLIDRPELQPVDKRSWETFLDILAELRVEAFVHETPDAAALERFGLGRPRVTVAVTADPAEGEEGGEKTVVLSLGAEDPEAGVVFARISGRSPVVGLPTAFLRELSFGYLEFLERDLLPHNEATVRVFAATDGRGTVRWEKGAGGQTWPCVEPEGAPAAEKSLMDATLKFGFLKAGKFYARDHARLAFFGLDEDSRALTLYFQYDDEGTPSEAVLYLGSRGPDGERLYATYRKGDFGKKGDLVFALERRALDNVRRLMARARGD